jgi:hypothetical protein
MMAGMSTCVLVLPNRCVWPSGSARHFGGSGCSAAAAAIFGDHRADARLHHLRPQAADDVGGAARRERNDQADRPLGIGASGRRRPHCRRERESAAREEMTSVHGAVRLCPLRLPASGLIARALLESAFTEP